MAHGYIGDDYGIDGGPENRERDSRDREWRGRDEHWRDRDQHGDRGMMFRGGERERGSSDQDRWSGGGESRQGSDRYQGSGEWQNHQRENESRGREQSGYGERQGRPAVSAHPDDHYRSWRDRHMQELDRHYEDYCREREQHLHRDFGSWLSNRQHGNPQPLRTGMTQTGMSHEPEGELQLTDPAKAGMAENDPMDAATLGTTTTTGKQR